MEIYLVRHGQDQDNVNNILNGRRDRSLTGQGREQAKITASKLKDKKIQRIYASPLKRAHETAVIIAEELSIGGVIIDGDLIERDFGILTGRPVEDIPRYTDKILATDKVNYFLEVEGAEDFPSVYQRARRFLEKIQKGYSDVNILVVTHGDIGKMLRAVYRGWTWERGLAMPYFDNADVIDLSRPNI